MWVRILTKRQASALRSEVAKLHNGSFTLRISNCKNRFNCFSVCLHQTSAFAERTDNFVTGPEVVGSSNPGSSIQNKDNKFMQLYTNLKNSSKFDRHLFIEGSQILQMLTDTAEISLCKEALMRHASLGGEFASLSPTQVLSCVASLGGLIRGNENDYILINQVIQLGAASRVGSNTVHGSTNISDFLRAFISLKCVHSHEGVASSLVSAILLPPLQSFASAGKGLSSADVCLAMSAVQWMLVSDPSTEQYLQTLLTIVGQSDSIPSENDVCRSFKYICNLRHFSTVADSVNVGLIRKLAQNLNALTTAGATKILNRLCGFSGDVNNLKCILSAIAPILPLPGMQMTPSQIGRAMYGLQKLKADTRDEQLVVRWLTGQMMTTPKGKCFTAGDISRCMVGMRSMDASFLTVQALMESVERGLYYTHGDMTAIQIATCFDCIRGKGRQANTRTVKLVEALTSHLVYFDEESGKILTAGFISMIVNGVSDLGLKEPCVRRILAIVDKHLQRSQDSVTEKNIKCNLAGILYATRNWSIDSQNSSELKALLHTVGLKLAGMRRIMGGYELAKCLYGLNSTNNKSKEVQNLLSVLNMQLSTAESTSFEGVHIGRGLYGLKSMSNYYPGALAMLDSLTAKLKDCDEVIFCFSLFSSVYLCFKSIIAYLFVAIQCKRIVYVCLCRVEYDWRQHGCTRISEHYSRKSTSI